MVDRLYGSVQLLLHFDGADGDTHIADEKGHPVLRFGNLALSDAQARFGATSLYADGSGGLELDPADIYLASAPDYDAKGTPDFTVEVFVLCESLDPSSWTSFYRLGGPGSGSGTSSYYMSGLHLGVKDGLLTVLAGNLSRDGWSGYMHLYSADPLPASGWCHVAFTARGQIPHVFIDGAESPLVFGNANTTVTTFDNLKLYCPRRINILSANRYDGVTDTALSSVSWASPARIDELRITKGAARYTSDFTPPEAPFANAGIPDDSRSLLRVAHTVIPERLAGNHRVRGTVRLDSAPAPERRVLLYDRKNMRPVARAITDSDGRYEFRGLRPGTYLVVGQDRRGGYHPDIARVASEPV